MTVILGGVVTLQQQVTCGVWIVAVVFIWDLAFAGLISHQTLQCILSKRIHLVERTAGAVLISFGVELLTRNR